MAGSRKYDSIIARIDSPKGPAEFYSLRKLSEQGHNMSALPYSIRILLENAIRNSSTGEEAEEAVSRLLEWPKSIGAGFGFMPYRVLLQDYTGIPLIVDLAAMRDAMKRSGGDAEAINSSVPMDLIIDHSVQVDRWGDALAFSANIEREYERNSERYSLLKWAQGSFRNLRVFPPGKGICHQVNLEYLSSVVALKEDGKRSFAIPDTLVGTDSHTTMVNGLGVLGWGVGGIEAEAVMLGEPYHMPVPRVVGVKMVGRLREGVTPTDIVLTVTELLRAKNVVDAFVEYFGEGYQHLSVPDRATLGNMSPEYGATVGFCPVDHSTIRYLTDTGRDPAYVRFVEAYCKEQGLFAMPDAPEPKYSEVLVVDLGKIEPSIAGPRNPEERRELTTVPGFARSLIEERRKSRAGIAPVVPSGSGSQVLVQRGSFGHDPSGLDDGSVIIAAITSCTNTSNPTVMIGAGLIAKKAVEKGLSPKPFVKGSLAPGSSVVKDYLEKAGLLSYLDKIGFNLVGLGCTTCIGNSGPLDPAIEATIKQRDLYTVAVLSGNRNFDGRIHPLAKGSFLMSPMLVVAYALAGRIDFDFSEPLGTDNSGEPVFLKDLWPSLAEIKDLVSKSMSSEVYRKRYADALVGDSEWNSLPGGSGETFEWDRSSTYVREPPWFDQSTSSSQREDIADARVLVYLEDKITTDHISPAGSIAVDSPAGKYLTSHGVDMVHFSTYGARRGNHEVMVRGGFANIRLRNLLADGKEGWYTKYLPTGEITSIYEASMKYGKTPLIVLAGKQYGSGSSRDWAAKAPKLLGVRAVIAESFERIHRSNLVAMGVLPLEFPAGQSAKSLGLKGDEVFSLRGLKDVKPGATLDVSAVSDRGEIGFTAKVRIDNGAEMQYYNSGGVLPFVFKSLRRGGV